MNNCESYAALLDAFAEGDLFYEDMIQVQQHLLNCPDCQAYLDDLLAMRAVFPTVADTEVPDGFADRVMAAVAAAPRAEIPAETSAKPSRSAKKTPWLKVLAPLAACCAIVILLQNGPLSGGRKEEAAFVSYTSSAAPAAPAGGAESPAAAADIAATEESYDAAAPAEAAAAPAAGGGQAVPETMPEAETAAEETGIAKKAEPTDGASSSHTSLTADSGAADLSSADYFAVLTLSAEGAHLLEAFPVFAESETELQYCLTSDESVALQKQLQRAGLFYSMEDGLQPTSEMVLVIVEK